MNIEVSIALDGKTITPSEDLQVSLVEIVESYIKQKIFNGKIVKKDKIKKAKDPNAPKREPRMKMTPDEIQRITDRARQLQHLTVSQASTILHQEFHRAVGSIYARLKRAEQTGELKFATVKH